MRRLEVCAVYRNVLGKYDFVFRKIFVFHTAGLFDPHMFVMDSSGR